MEEVREEVKVVKVSKRCHCGGEMLPTGMVLTSYPEQYPHKCTNCGNMETYFVKYPKIEYIPV